MPQIHFHDHSPHGVYQRLKSDPPQSYLRDFVYGGIDGSVTTFAVVAGVAGAHLNPLVLMVLGLANIFADGFSMAAANFLATKAEKDEIKFYEDVENEHIRVDPQGEEREIRQLYINKGFAGHILDEIVKHTIGNKTLWIKTMLREEYGLPAQVRSPVRAALATFIAFMTCGFVALFAFVFHLHDPFIWSSCLTAIVFFTIGSVSSIWSVKPWWKTGLSTLAVGAIAAGLAYAVGVLFTIK